MSEVVNKILMKISYTYYKVYDGFLGLVNKLFASLKGVKYGEKFRTYGKIFFFRHPNSSISIGDNCEIRSRTTSNLIGINKKSIIATHASGAKIIIGNNCGFSGVTIGCQELIVIGDNCLIGGNTLICDTDWHSLKADERLIGKARSKPTLIRNNVFIGSGSVILKGAIIGENSVIGAHSVVTGEIPANVIAAGNPCKVLKPL